MKTKKIKDCLPLVNGLWAHINYEFPEVFDIDPSQLDILFLSNWSMRTAAPIMNVIHSDEHTSMLNDEELTNLAGIVNGMYKHKWDKLMAVALAEYDPIHNYSDHLIEEIEYSEDVDGTKSESGSNSSTRTDNLSRTETGGRGYTDTYNITNRETHDTSNTTTYNTTNTETNNITISKSNSGIENLTDTRSSTETRNLSNSGSNSGAENLFGFNSSDAVGDRTNSGSSSGSETGTIGVSHTGGTSTTTSETGSEGKTGTVADAKTGTETDAKTGTVTDAKTGTEGRTYSGTLTEQNTGTQGNVGTSTNSETTSNDTAGEKTREYTKTGNIGNISTQKLLNEELDLWKYNFICEIMRDVVGLITLPIYEQ